MGEAGRDASRVGFDRTVKLEFHAATVSSDAGLLPYRDLDDVVQLTETTAAELLDFRTGRNIQHSMTALLRQSIYGRLAGYEYVNDADRLGVDPVMRQVVGGPPAEGITDMTVRTAQQPNQPRGVWYVTPSGSRQNGPPGPLDGPIALVATLFDVDLVRQRAV